MARVPIRIYKNSFLASVVSIFGTILSVSGIAMLFAVPLGGIVCILLGIGLFIWGGEISENKAFKKWIKDLESKGVVAALPASSELCVKVYNANPCKKTLNFIRKHNPNAAQLIENSLAQNKK